MNVASRRTRMRHLEKTGHRLALPLHFAIWNKMASEIRYLVENGADVDAQDAYGRTALMMCCMENDEDWSVGIATMLLQVGANASLCDSNKRNSLMYSLIFGKKRLTELLLKSKDCDLNQKDRSRRTVIDYASMCGSQELVSRLSRSTAIEQPETVSEKNASESKILAQRRPKSSPVCTTIIRNSLASARVHAPNSDMNTHQFRRLVKSRWGETTETMRKFNSPSPVRENKRTLPRSKSAGPRRSATNVIAPVRHSYSSTAAAGERKTQRPKSASWKSIVPILWDAFSVQHSHSYRHAAKPLRQTYEEALGIAPAEDSNEDGAVSGDDNHFQDDNQQIVPRRSSMPTSSQLSHPSYKSRRRSEAIGLSSSSLKKFFFSEKKVDESFVLSPDTDSDSKSGKRFDSPADSDGDSKRRVQKENKAISKERSNSLPTAGKHTDHDNGTARMNRRSSLPLGKLSRDGPSSARVNRRGSLAIINSNLGDFQDPVTSTSSDDSENSESHFQLPPQRMQQPNIKRRRRESILSENRLLPNITEEQ